MFLMTAIDVARELSCESQSILPEWQIVFEKQVKRPEFWTSPVRFYCLSTKKHLTKSSVGNDGILSL